MTARHKKKVRARPAHRPPHSEASIEEKRLEGRREIWTSFWLSIAITLTLCGVNRLVEETDFGKQVEEMAYDLLQNSLSSAPTTDDLKVVVLDISKIPMRPSQGLQPGSITDRAPLKYLVNSLVTMQNPPRAIGLDVDFSPDSHGYADPEDPEIFDLFLKHSDKIPVRVGVNSSLALGKEKWLNNPSYTALASCVVIPKPESVQSAWYMPEWLDVKYSSAPNDGSARCPSMGVSLVKATVKPVPRGFGWFAETTHQDTEGTFVNAPRFLVDYSQLSKFEDRKISVPEIHTPADAAKFAAELDSGGNLLGQIVLLGRVSNANDIFTIPGKPVKAYAGVFLHACAVYTLLQSRPLYRLSGKGRFLLDVLFSALVFGPLFWIRTRRLEKGKEDFMDFGVPEMLSFLVTGVLVVAAIWGVRKTHLMWDDFILVAAALIVHTPAEHAAEKIGAWLSPFLPSWVHVSPASSRSHSESAK